MLILSSSVLNWYSHIQPLMEDVETVFARLCHLHHNEILTETLGLSLYLHPLFFVYTSPVTLYKPRGYKTFSMLNSAEHKIYPAHK